MDKQQCIAVTGGTGLIGSYLLRHLVKEGYRNIRASHREHSRFDLVEPVRDHIDWYEGDILDITFLDQLCRDADIVIHAAAIVSFSKGNRQKLTDVNIRGTANVVNACLAADMNTLIHVSSTATLSAHGTDLPADEHTDWKKSKLNTPYAKSKFRAELEAFRGYAEGMDVRVINPSIVIGSGFWNKSSANLFPKISRGIPFYPKGSTGFVDVRDIALMIEQLIRNGQPGERYICSGGHLSHYELMQIGSEELGSSPPKWALQNWMIPFISSFFGLLSLFGEIGSSVTNHSLKIAQQVIRFDNRKSIRELDMQYRDPKASVRETARSYARARAKDLDFDILPLHPNPESG